MAGWAVVCIFKDLGCVRGRAFVVRNVGNGMTGSPGIWTRGYRERLDCQVRERESDCLRQPMKERKNSERSQSASSKVILLVFHSNVFLGHVNVCYSIFFNSKSCMLCGAVSVLVSIWQAMGLSWEGGAISYKRPGQWNGQVEKTLVVTLESTTVWPTVGWKSVW